MCESCATALGTIQTRLQSVQSKISSLVQVMRLLQHYTSARDKQYDHQLHSRRAQPNTLTRSRSNRSHHTDYQQIRSELNSKVEITVRVLNEFEERQLRTEECVRELTHAMNRMENDVQRHKMVVEKEVEGIQEKVFKYMEQISVQRVVEPLLKISHVSEKSRSNKSKSKSKNQNKNQSKSKSKNKNKNQSRSRSQKDIKMDSKRSLSPGVNIKSAVSLKKEKGVKKGKDEELKEAIRRKREHKEKLRAL